MEVEEEVLVENRQMQERRRNVSNYLYHLLFLYILVAGCLYYVSPSSYLDIAQS